MSVYAVSDLHGQFGLYQEIKKFLNPEDIVYCLGDCGDRGPASWETIKAIANDPQFIYLLGNHEHMLLGAMCDYLDLEKPQEFNASIFGDMGDMIMPMLAYNGGMDTLQGWIDEGADPRWIKFFQNLPVEASYKNVILCHAGYTLGEDMDRIDKIWDRGHFYEAWPEDKKNFIMVHGHTPCPLLVREFIKLQKFYGVKDGLMQPWTPHDGAVWYAGGNKVDIDMAAFATNQTLLLDLDTFDEHIFKI